MVLRRFLLATAIETVLLSWTSDPLDVPNFQSLWDRRLKQRKGYLSSAISDQSFVFGNSIVFDLNSVSGLGSSLN